MEKSTAHAKGAAASPSRIVHRRRRPKALGQGRQKGKHVSIWLTPAEFDDVGALAAAMGMGRSTWIGALMRKAVQARPTFGPADEASLISILVALRRIGVDISQTLRLIDTAALEDEDLGDALAQLATLRAEIRGHMRAIHKAFDGNMAFWSFVHE